MRRTWTVKDSEGHVLPGFTGPSRLDVERKVVPTHYDAFRLHVSSSYRQMFARDLAKVLARRNWQIIRLPTQACGKAPTVAGAQLELGLN
jgi:hypothetical protein